MLKATMTKLKSKSQARPVKAPEIQALPLVPWVGGKRRLAQHILPLFPEHSCYVEPFCGAAALFFLKEPAKVEVLNDVHGELVRLYRVVQNHLDEFVRQFRWALASREMYGWLQAVPPDTLTDIQRAARFFYLQKLGFGRLPGDFRFRLFGREWFLPITSTLLLSLLAAAIARWL